MLKPIVVQVTYVITKCEGCIHARIGDKLELPECHHPRREETFRLSDSPARFLNAINTVPPAHCPLRMGYPY